MKYSRGIALGTPKAGGMTSIGHLMSWILVFVAAIVILSSLSFGQSERSLVRDGNNAYKEKKFTDAEVNYRKALEKNKDLHTGVFNLGDALYKQERYDESAEQYKIAAAKSTDAETRAAALHNLGNALLKQKKLEESIAAYKESMKIKGDDADTKYNYEYAKALLQKQQQEQKDQKQNKNDKNDKQKQDQQKQDQQKQDQQKKDQDKQDQQKQDQQKQDQQKQDQQQQDQQKQDQKQGQQKKQQISKQDAERILEALKNEEQNVQKKLHKKVPARVKVEKDW